MSQLITLMARNTGSLALVLTTQETFLDSAEKGFVGKRFPPNKGLNDPMLIIVQGTAITVPVQLINPDGTNFDLTNVTSLQMGIFQKTPTRQLISATAGSPSGQLTDGTANFSIPETDTNFIGFARGIITGTKLGKPFAFEKFEAKYEENPFLALP